MTHRLHIVKGFPIPYVPRSALLTAMRLGLQVETHICGRYHGSLTSLCKWAYKRQLVSWVLSDSRRNGRDISPLFYYVCSRPRKSGKRERFSAKFPKGTFFSIFQRWGPCDEACLAEVGYPSTSSHIVTISSVLPVSGNPSWSNPFIYLNWKGSNQHWQALLLLYR